MPCGVVCQSVRPGRRIKMPQRRIREPDAGVAKVLRRLAQIIGLVVVVLAALMVLVASQAGTGRVWLMIVSAVGVATLGYVIAVMRVRRAAEGIGGTMMSVAGLAGGIGRFVGDEGAGLAGVLESSLPFLVPGVLFVVCWWLSRRMPR